MSFDKRTLELMRKDIYAVLEKVANKYNTEFEIGNISYDSVSFKTVLKCSANSAGSLEEIEFSKKCCYLNLNASDYKRNFSSNGNIFKLIAIKPRNTRYPVIGISAEGKRFKFNKEVLNNLI